MRTIALIVAVALSGCASTPALIYPVSPTPLETPAPFGTYPRDHCGEDITPTHPATPDTAVCN